MLELIEQYVPATPAGCVLAPELNQAAGQGNPKYIRADGARCAIGAMIPEDCLDMVTEGRTVVRQHGELKDRLPLNVSLEGLSDLQLAHDAPQASALYRKAWDEMTARDRCREWVERAVEPVRVDCGHKACAERFTVLGTSSCTEHLRTEEAGA